MNDCLVHISVHFSDLHMEDMIRGREVVDSVNYLNENFAVLNTDKFGPVESVKTVVVIQVRIYSF